MSYKRDRVKKDKKKSLRTEYEKSVARKIKNGLYPTFHLAKREDGANLLERKSPAPGKRPKLTLRQLSTFKVLTKDERK